MRYAVRLFYELEHLSHLGLTLVSNMLWFGGALLALALALLPIAAGLCEDAHTDTDRASCASWAKGGECDRNPDYMRLNCAASCGFCSTPPSTSAGHSSTTSIPIEPLLAKLKTARAWPPAQLASLRAALDPDGDGLVDNEDWMTLTGSAHASGSMQPERSLGACAEAASPVTRTPSSSAHPSSSSSPLPGDGALSTRVAERMPTFVLSKTPPKVGAEDLYYVLRAEVGSALDAHAEDVFEKCASRCLQSDECWMISISPQAGGRPNRNCCMHTKLWGFTSVTV